MAGLTAIKRKGFRGGGMDASTQSFDASANPGRKGGPIGRDDSARDGKQGFTDQQIANQNAVTEQYRRNQAIKKDIEKRKLEKSNYGAPKKNFNIFDFGKNYLRNRQKGIYNLIPNNPKRELQFLSSLQITDPAKYDRLPQNLKDLLENTQFDFSGTFEDQPKFSFDDFESLTQFDDGAFAKYAKDRGSPGLSVSGDMSQIGIKSVRRDQFGNPVKDIFGNTLFDYGPAQDGGGGEGQNLLPLNYGVGVGTGNTDDVADETTFDYRFGTGQKVGRDVTLGYAANGGRITRAGGGIMNVVPRQAYGLGDIVKSITKPFKSVAKAAGKVLKSDLGKAAMLAGAYYYGGGSLPFIGARQGASGFGTTGIFSGLKDRVAGSDFFSKMLMNKDKTGFSPFKVATLASPLLAFTDLAKAPVDQMPDGMSNRGGRLLDSQGNEVLPSGIRKEIDEAYASGDPGRIEAIENYYAFLPPRNMYLPYPNYAVGGRVAAQEGGLMDLGGMEKDYRNEGGFVPIGKEEKADDVPARLSVNEFVFTADAVRNAGGGDIDKGAEVMENMMKNLENGGTVSEESQGKGNTGAQEMFSVSERIGEVI